MATAARIKDYDNRKRIEWFTVQDDAGAVSTYRRSSNVADASSMPDVRCENTGQGWVLVLSRGTDGQYLLRQKEPGLPEKAIVSFDDPPMRGTATGLAAGGTYFLAAERAVFVRGLPQRSKVEIEELAVDPKNLSK